MDQQLELKLDVKEAAAIPTDHPQWDISEEVSKLKIDPFILGWKCSFSKISIW